MTLAELQEKRNKLAAEIKTRADAFNANGKKWKDEEERKAWDTVNADYDATCREMDELRAAEDVDRRLAAVNDLQNRSVNDGNPIPGREDRSGRQGRENRDRPEITDETRSIALAGWMAGQLGRRCTQRQMEAMESVGLQPWMRELAFDLLPTHDYRTLQNDFRSVHPSQGAVHCLNSRALTTSGATSGATLIPASFVRQLEVNMLAYGGVRQVAETITTTGGEDLTWPTGDDTSNEAAILAESTTIGASTDPTFGSKVWGAYKFSSKPVLVPYELIEDAMFDLPAVLGQMLGERIGRGTNRSFTTGTGSSQPNGIVTASSLGVTAASATAVTADEVIRLVHSVDPAYRQGAGFMMNDAIVLAIRLLKEATTNQYLWQPGLRDGVPDRLLGYVVTLNQHMASAMAASAKVMLFGQLSKYKIRRVNRVRFYRLEERYRDTDQDGFVAFLREDGNLLDAGTAPVKHLIMDDGV